MKKLILSLCLAFTALSAVAMTHEQQFEVLSEIEATRVEVSTIRSLIPDFLGKTVGAYLDRVDMRLAKVERILAEEQTDSRVFCTIDSAFDGQFYGKGQTELEAKINAIRSCEKNSQHNGFFCKKDTLYCEK